jgi:uroporphyrinogen decarboxylase
MKTPLLLQAFEGTNPTVPVWFMRQAGRYLPEYQKIRKGHPLSEMFTTPEIAAEVTCQPVDILGVDAAILFADILTLPSKMGIHVDFDGPQGPVIVNPVSSAGDVERIHDFEDLSSVAKTIRLVNKKLPADIPLIGFAGSPFTVLSYLVEGGSLANFRKMFQFAQQQPEAFHQLMEILTRNTIGYLDLQKEAGIKVFQLFDTWAGILRPSDYAHWVLPYVRKIFEQVKLPSIYYVKNTAHLLPLLHQSNADFLSVCQTVVLGHDRILEKNDQGVQGNLFNGLLYAENSVLEKEINDVLIGAKQHYKRYIFNLSHGVFPNTDVEKLKFIVKKVHQFKWKG